MGNLYDDDNDCDDDCPQEDGPHDNYFLILSYSTLESTPAL